jgi:ribosomal protein S18 acetylase RimI-like enzyme
VRLYKKLGFVQIGIRKGYYPNGNLPREDALVLSKSLFEST